MNAAATTTYYTHGFHPYPAKFTPQIVDKFLRQYCRPGAVVLDPFCGSGTTLVESALNSMDSVGIDLNPVAYVVSRAKSINYTAADVAALQNFLFGLEENSSFDYANLADDIALPDFPNRHHWFQDNVSYELMRLKAMIDDETNDNAKSLLLCAFSKIIVRVSNQDSEVRYTARQKNHPDNIVFKSFIDTLKKYLVALAEAPRADGRATVYRGNSVDVLKQFPSNHFDFVITSPPYINTFDYYLYHKQRIFWLGFDHSYVRQNEIGCHHRVDLKKPHVSKAEYFNAMSQIMRGAARVSKPDSRFVMIIGDGIVKGEVINMAEIVSDLCGDCGYSVESSDSVNLSEITKSFNKKFTNAPKKEHTIVLKNNKR